MSSSSSDAPSNDSTHSDPIPISLSQSYRTRSRSASESSDDSVPPLSPSQSPASASSVNIGTPVSSSSRPPVSPVAPSSPILSYFYGAPVKSPFTRSTFSNTTFEEDESQEPPPAPANVHGRRMSTSWIPVRFGPQQQQQNTPATESQHDRGVGVLRRLSISNPLASKPPVSGRSSTPPKQDGGTRPGGNSSPRASGQLRKAATLSAGTVDASSRPRAPSPMGERMLKGHYDGF